MKDGVSQNFGFIETNSITPFKNMYAFNLGLFIHELKKPYILLFGLYQSGTLLFPLISNTHCQGAAVTLFWGQRSGSPL